ncbi:helix-turn-helix transcriptional regulator [Dolosigranulum pigrum]|uniref:helix-turn-helix transcriptional regulator n=1 Tax=Dolosigranulum pigrum TaxID=29394 RepID=UPI001AD884F4|nr:helix-turn-helix transcriptional regulator [Dolosigranulum pigrum]QTJ49194.1 helix-turn-helix transcriptional regulator [Dolosigranulum pigrum]QTJ50495.1 helix-turn-helix transcriptional regulator [Dolosigranulum pigrum]
MSKELTTGKMIKEARIDRGLSKWQLADKMGLSREYIKDVENDKTEIDHVLLGEFCEALGLRKVEDLV